MVKKIQQKIVGFAVVRDTERPLPDLEQMHEEQEHVGRSAELQTSTYRISTPYGEHALDVAISDIILNPGTPHELRRPFEICISSKDMREFQWIVVLFRLISAVFRRGGDVTFVVEELRSTFDPGGDSGKKGGQDVPLLAAEIGDILETHLKHIGIPGSEANERTRRDPAEIRQDAFLPEDAVRIANNAEGSNSTFPLSAELCRSCRAKAAVYLDGCLTCLSCGDSKCS